MHPKTLSIKYTDRRNVYDNELVGTLICHLRTEMHLVIVFKALGCGTSSRDIMVIYWIIQTQK